MSAWKNPPTVGRLGDFVGAARSLDDATDGKSVRTVRESERVDALFGKNGMVAAIFRRSVGSPVVPIFSFMVGLAHREAVFSSESEIE